MFLIQYDAKLPTYFIKDFLLLTMGYQRIIFFLSFEIIDLCLYSYHVTNLTIAHSSSKLNPLQFPKKKIHRSLFFNLPLFVS